MPQHITLTDSILTAEKLVGPVNAQRIPSWERALRKLFSKDGKSVTLDDARKGIAKAEEQFYASFCDNGGTYQKDGKLAEHEIDYTLDVAGILHNNLRNFYKSAAREYRKSVQSLPSAEDRCHNYRPARP